MGPGFLHTHYFNRFGCMATGNMIRELKLQLIIGLFFRTVWVFWTVCGAEGSGQVVGSPRYAFDRASVEGQRGGARSDCARSEQCPGFKTEPRTRGPGGLHGHFQPRHRLLRPQTPAKTRSKQDPSPSPRLLKSPTRSKKTFASRFRKVFVLDRVGAPFCTCWPGLGGVRGHGFNPGQRNQVSERFNCWPGAGGDDAVAPSGAHALRATAFGRMAREVCNGAC